MACLLPSGLFCLPSRLYSVKIFIHQVSFYFNGSHCSTTNCRKQKNKNNYVRISSGHIIPFGDMQDIISIHCDLSNPTVCKFIVNIQILHYQDYFD